MVLLSVFIVLAVGILSFAYITNGFNAEGQKRLPAGVDAGDLLDSAYEQKVHWLRDLESDLVTGKIGETDYSEQKQVLEREALMLLAQKESRLKAQNSNEQKDVEELIQDRRLERLERSAGFCSKCGQPLQRSDQFCPSCGNKKS
jgi:rubrerythrin